LLGDPWSRVSYADGEVAVYHLGGDTDLARIGKLDCITDEVEQHLGQALLVTEPNG
jgi:hypothetical protein